MRKKLKDIGLLVLSVSCMALVSTSIMAADDPYDCGGNTANGTYTGKLVKVMDQNIWPRTTYEFNWLVDEKEVKRGCLKIDDKNLNGTQIMYDAYKLGRVITVTVGGPYASFVTAIAMKN